MLKRPAFLSLVAVAATGCVEGPYNAPVGATISVEPEAIYVSPSDTIYAEDNVGYLVMGNIMVADATRDDLPLGNIKVEASAPPAGVYLLPPEAVKLVDGPTQPVEDGQVSDVCIDPESGEVLNDGETEWCAWGYDMHTGQYMQFSSSYAGAADSTPDGEPYRPNYMQSATDRNGFLRFYAFVDALPCSTEGATARGPAPPADTGGADTGFPNEDTGNAGGDDGAGVTNCQDALVWFTIGHDSAELVIAVVE